MAELSPIKKFIQEAEVKYKAAISEITATKIGRMLNFLGHRLHEQKAFFLNGHYKIGAGQTGVDGLAVFEYDAEIFNVWAFNLVAGISGTTEIDLKLITDPGGSPTSIFTTTPKIDSTASNNVWVGIGDVVTGCTAPVLTSDPNVLNVNAGDAIRCDLIQAMTGAENCGVIIHYRPR